MLLYFPDLNPEESITIPKLLGMFWKKFGIGIGIVGQSNPTYNWLNVPMWLGMMYRQNTIGVDEFLIKFPDDATVHPEEMNKAIMDLGVFGVRDPRRYVLQHQKKIKRNPNTIIPFYKL